MIEEPLKYKKTEEWQEILNKAGIPNGPINTIDKVINDPQIKAREMIAEINHPLVGKFKVPGIPIKLSETPGKIRKASPILGEHTEEVLKELLGYEESEIGELVNGKV